MNKPASSVGIVLIAESGGGAAVAIERLLDLAVGCPTEVHALGNDLPWIWRVPIADRRRLVLPDAKPGSLRSGLIALRSAMAMTRTMLAIRRYCRESPNLVLLPFLTGTALITLAATFGLPNPVIVCERNDPSRQRHGWHVEILKRLLYPRATAITVNSPGRAARDRLVRVSRGRPVHFVPNPRPRGMSPADVRSSRVILSVGRLVPQKRHETLIEAFARIHDRIPDWTLRIAGDGPLREHLTNLVEQLGLTHEVEFLQHVEDTAQLYASAGLFVLPSDFEGTSNAMLEAASAGLPCILSEEIAPLENSDAFLTAPAGAPSKLSRVILRACSDVNIRTVLGDAARNWVSSPTDAEVLSAWANAVSADPMHPPGGAPCRIN